MIFTSYTYIAFLSVCFLTHWALPERARKLFLVVASYLFYCSWRWEYGFLLVGVSLFNWEWGHILASRRESTWPLLVGIGVNLTPLLYFKYTGFLLRSFDEVLHQFGANGMRVPEILLPLGISFFTFQGIAYLIDVTGGAVPIRKLGDFLLFKGFWPQLIAGPIIRLGEIREQIEGQRNFKADDLAWGLQRILQGFLKKAVLADNLAPAVEMVFLPTASPGFVDVAVGVVAFGLQIYFDFSGYSDIAIGSARLFGFHFPENFNWPYLAISPRDFWNRWHMTLSSWIRDYVFTPMAFSLRQSRFALPIAVVAAMGICGLWHGAAWHFIIWGIWHGLLLLVAEGTALLWATGKPRGSQASKTTGAFGAIASLVAVNVGWVFFRAASLGHAWSLLQILFGGHWDLRPHIVRENTVLFVALIAFGVFVGHIWHSMSIRPRWFVNGWIFVEPVARPLAYALGVALVIVAERGSQAFVYFQF